MYNVHMYFMYKHPRKRWTWMYDARPLWKYSERATTCQVHRQRTWRSLRALQRTRRFQEHPVLTQAEVWDASYKMVKHKSPSWEIPEPTLSVLSMGGWVPVLGWDKWRWFSAGNELTLSLVEEARRSLEHQKKVTSKYSTASIYIARPDKSISLYEHIIVAVHRQIRGNWWEKTSHILHNKIQVLTLLGNILLWDVYSNQLELERKYLVYLVYFQFWEDGPDSDNPKVLQPASQWRCQQFEVALRFATIRLGIGMKIRGAWVRSHECSVLSSVTLWCHSLTNRDSIFH